MTETAQQRIQSLEQHLSSQPRSPLFAQLAGYYLDAGRSREALDLCDKGLSHFPFYPTGHLIKGKALLALNMPAEARREFEFVQGYFPGIDSLTRLLRDLPSGDIETLAASKQPEPASVQTAEPQPVIEAPTEQQTEGEPITAEANPDQWLSQFTEAAAETSTAPAEPAQETVGAPVATEPEITAPESPETFSFPGETPLEPQLGASVQSEEVFGLTAPQEPAAEAEPPVSQETPVESTAAAFETAQTGESFQNFAERKRGELFGLENSLSLDEYLAVDQPLQPAVEVVPESAESPVEDPFAALAQQPEAPSLEDPFATLGQQSEEASVETPPEQASQDPFAQLQQDFPSQTAEEPAPQDESAAQERDQIEELADKLQGAKKITPIIDLSERTAVPPSESETPSGTGFVTPTLAEIYAKQGWYDDAIKAYKTLALSKPAERDKFEKRIQELEDLKRQQQSG